MAKPTHPSKNLKQILQRLPLQQLLTSASTQSDTLLQEIMPVWSTWCQTHMPDSNTMLSVSGTTTSTATLVVHCAHASDATKIKHQQDTILTSLRASGCHQINQVKIQISPSINCPTQANNQQNDYLADAFHNTHTDPITDKQTLPNKNAIEAIIKCSELTNSDQLSRSLSQLAATLGKNLSKQN